MQTLKQFIDSITDMGTFSTIQCEYNGVSFYVGDNVDGYHPFSQDRLDFGLNCKVKGICFGDGETLEVEII